MMPRVRSICSLCVIAAILVTAALAQPVSDGSISPQNLKLLNHWLREIDRSKLRPATIDDLEEVDALSHARAVWGDDYFPYYRVGDFNRDQEDDFALVLVDPTIKDKNRFSIAVFHGRKGDNPAPALLEERKDLSKRGLFESVGLIVAALKDEDDCIIYMWDGKLYLAKNCVTPPM